MALDPTQPLPILRIRPVDLPDAVLVVGDPARAEWIGSGLTDAQKLGQYREYVTWRGTHQGRPVAVVSHGVGSGGAGICFEELCRAGARRIIRGGTAGGMQDRVLDGHLVIATAAVRDEGFTERLVPLAYPAVASRRLVEQLARGASALSRPVHEGIALSSAVFYPLPVLGSTLDMWQRAGVLAVEQECAALFVIAAQHGVDAAAILTIDGNPLLANDTDMSGYDPHRDDITAAVADAVGVALDALVAD